MRKSIFDSFTDVRSHFMGFDYQQQIEWIRVESYCKFLESFIQLSFKWVIGRKERHLKYVHVKILSSVYKHLSTYVQVKILPLTKAKVHNLDTKKRMWHTCSVDVSFMQLGVIWIVGVKILHFGTLPRQMNWTKCK